MESTGTRRNSLVLAEADRLPRGGTSRMRRESHVRNLWGTRGANPRVYPATSTVKRRDIRSRHVGIRETNANEPPTTHRNTTPTTSEPELPARAGRSTEATYLLAVRCPVYRGRHSDSGFRTELENLVGDVKGKGTSGSPARPKVPMCRPGADCSVVAVKRINSRGAKGAGHPS